jgi:bifunctional DNA-binding transcriptional regulator/antitoxin component of YhaV-PrlF toxin-antitoxin module
MVKLQFDSNQQFKITLPKQLAKAKRWKKGDELAFELDDKGNLIIKKEGEAGQDH